uniref:Probable ABC transporter permease protein Ycf63 n=1 Tax=Laurencia australis TaxID=3073067 RepID=A0AA51NE07_9FLOR|nr:Probable ABC transporter permease protein Ycf63 [Laurencia australis]WMP11978.1 Probable ABC transporter permease protein Ycf63 [Laurencia australis]
MNILYFLIKINLNFAFYNSICKVCAVCQLYIFIYSINKVIMNVDQVYEKFFVSAKVVIFFLYYLCGININLNLVDIIDYTSIVSPQSLFITMITSFFISLVFSLQIAKEFMYLDAIQLVGTVFSVSFIRELSPVLTSVIIVGKVCSSFTSELATMVSTEQLDALFILGINPINYLILPRIISMIIGLPMLNCISIVTSILSGVFICCIFYGINPSIFLSAVFYNSLIVDLFKSVIKTVFFAFFIGLISCVWGITSLGGSRAIGLSTTSSVVNCLLIIFILNFILSYFLFDNLTSSFQFS